MWKMRQSLINYIIYDGDGIITMEDLKAYGYDEEYPEYKPIIVEVGASEDMYNYIENGTDYDVELYELLRAGE